MRNGYVDLDFDVLDQLLKFHDARIIGGKVLKERTLRLLLVLNEDRDRFDDSLKRVSIEDLIDPA